MGGIGHVTTPSPASSGWTARWAQISHESTQKRGPRVWTEARKRRCLNGRYLTHRARATPPARSVPARPARQLRRRSRRATAGPLLRDERRGQPLLRRRARGRIRDPRGRGRPGARPVALAVRLRARLLRRCDGRDRARGRGERGGRRVAGVGGRGRVRALPAVEVRNYAAELGLVSDGIEDPL